MIRPETEQPSPLPPYVAVVGPTATGKSRFAQEVARRFGGEIVSCDSMAVYRGMDIGTDKPSPGERAAIPHHLLDVADPGTFFSAGAFRAEALRAMRDIWFRGRLCVIVGGTGLYYRALTRGLVDLPPRQHGLRERLRARLAREGAPGLHRLLKRLDPVSAGRIQPADAQRIERALEVRLATGHPLSGWIASSPFRADAGHGSLVIGLTGPRDVLYARVERRVDDMMARGFLEEVRRLLAAEVLHDAARKAIGYGELADHLQGLCTLEAAVSAIKVHTRHLAKRQLTWFRKEEDIRWYDLVKEAWSSNAIEFIDRWVEETHRRP